MLRREGEVAMAKLIPLPRDPGGIRERAVGPDPPGGGGSGHPGHGGGGPWVGCSDCRVRRAERV